MATPERSTPQPALTAEVLLAAAAFSISSGTAAGSSTLSDGPSALLLMGWPPFALAGGVILDARPQAPLGRALIALSLVPVVVLLWASILAVGPPTSTTLVQAMAELAPLQVAAVAFAVPWAVSPPSAPRRAIGCALVALTGALAVLLLRARSEGTVVGWLILVIACVWFLTMTLHEARDADRATARRTTWLVLTLTLAGTVAAATWVLPAELVPFVVCFDLWVTVVVVAMLSFTDDFRPLPEHALDLGVGLSVLGAALVVGALVRVGVGWTRMESPTTFAAFSALVTASLAVPAGLRIRRTMLARRYGSGTISPADVAVITADLHAQTEPRDLLDKAARMVASASGSPQARLVLGFETPAVPNHWVVHPLIVGGDQVGALLVESAHPEGPELRQERIVAQLLPTVALVARAVGLAVEAEHARRDVARERDAERKRILSDLHDGLGPVLAGMSMRVLAALRTTPDSEYAGLLRDLATDLAGSRTDLRGLVAGITPSVLDEGDLESALARLVRSFQEGSDGPRMSFAVALDQVLPTPVQVAVYRSVAEGITNALRHADATCIDVSVRSSAGLVLVDVVDDGAGGPVVPGVGLSSLRQRAYTLGGCLELAPAIPKGTRLHLQLPAQAGART